MWEMHYIIATYLPGVYPGGTPMGCVGIGPKFIPPGAGFVLRTDCPMTSLGRDVDSQQSQVRRDFQDIVTNP